MYRKNESILNQLAVFPWWITLIIAAIIYPTLKFVLPVISFDNQIISAFTQGVSRIAHLVLVPFIAVAAFSLINQFRKSKMMEEQTGLDSIQNISWRQFEELVGEVFRKQGHLVIENPFAGADGGVDFDSWAHGGIQPTTYMDLSCESRVVLLLPGFADVDAEPRSGRVMAA